MKCKNCGADLTIEDNFCSFCGTENPAFAQHREDMKRYQDEFRKTKTDVYKTTGKITGFSVKIAIIAVEIVVIFLICYMNVGIYGLEYALSGVKLSMNSAQHIENIESMIENQQYYELNQYDYMYDFYMDETFNEYNAILQATRYYTYIYKNVMESIDIEASYYSGIEYSADNIQDYLEYFYSILNEDRWYDESQYTEEHVATIYDILDRTNLILEVYLEIPGETIDDFQTMTAAQRQIVIEDAITAVREERLYEN